MSFMGCVRDDGHRITKMSYRALSGKVHTVKEICIEKQAVNAKEKILFVRDMQ